MDYLELKKTLIAAFDHFLSCHDFNELEEMMQAFEMGKKLIIAFSEPIDRNDYAQDVATMIAVKPRKIVSRIKRKKPKKEVVAQSDHKAIKICDIPVLLDLAKLSKDKIDALKDALKGDHYAQIHDFKMTDIHGFAKASIFKRLKSQGAIPSGERFRCAPHDSSFSFGGEQVKQKTEFSSDHILRENLIQKIMFEIKKHKDPP